MNHDISAAQSPAALTALVALLHQAEAAHGRYEDAELGGMRDAQWPHWYARYLEDHGFDALPGVNRPAGVASLAAWLVAADASHRAQAPTEPWTAYYARYFLA